MCVAARVRPQLFTELSRGDAQIVRVNGEKLIVANPDAFLADPSLITAFASAAALDNYQFDDWVKLFRFDYCFWTPPHDTSDFEELNQTQVNLQLGMLKRHPMNTTWHSRIFSKQLANGLSKTH